MGRKSREKKLKRQQENAATEAPQSPQESQTSKDQLILGGVSLCFLLSGFAALLYQTAWLRQFSIVFGTSELAVATVLAAYMAGLGLGAAVAARMMHRIRRPVLVYGVLEAGIAVSALLVPLLLSAAHGLHVQLLGGQLEPPSSGGLLQPFYYLAVSFLILALPTGFMGATLPLLTRYAVRQNEQVGPRVALLYGINTLGAVFGTTVAAFFLLPRFGLLATVWFGVFVNFLVFLVAAWLAKKAEDTNQALGADSTTAQFGKQASVILPLILLSGANAFLYEVLWTRLLSHVLGGTVYAFATMLASFLFGIALGGAFSGRFAKSRGQAVQSFVACQILIAIAAAFVYQWLQSFVPHDTGLSTNVILAVLVILPSTVFIGATFPLAVRVLATDERHVGVATGRTYAWNTVGAIVGSVIAGFLLIPAVGFEGAVLVAIFVNLCVALITLLVFDRGAVKLAVVSLVALAVAGFYRPGPPSGLIDTSVVDDYRGGEPLFYQVGRSATVYLKEQDGYFYLRTNGLPEAFVEPKGAPPIRHTQKWLTALPVIARPDAESILVVGFGGGVAIEGVPPSLSDVDVIELEPKVIAANRVVAAKRRYDPLSDDRVKIIENDARNALTLTSKQYDIVVSQPSHPWTAGASHLYTSEFVDLVHERLKPGGVFVQWINSTFIDESLLRTLCATVLAHFPNVRIYQPAPTTLLFLASDDDLSIERALQQTGRPISDSPDHYALMGLQSVEDLLIALTTDEEGVRALAEGVSVNSDNNNRMALFSRTRNGMSAAQLSQLMQSHDPLLEESSWVFNSLDDINLVYVGSRLITGGFSHRAKRLSQVLSDKSTAITIDALGLRHQGQQELAQKALRAAIQLDPSNDQARYAYVWSKLGSLAQGTASDEMKTVAAGLQGSAGKVLEGWRLGIQRDWVRLAADDDVLAEAKPTDLWYPEAVKLRADWRIQGTTDSRFGQEAQAMLDKALVILPITDLLVIRAGAAIRKDDARTFVETAHYVQTSMEERLQRVRRGDYVLSAREKNTIEQRVSGFIRQLESDFAAPVRQRANQVRAGFKKLERLLSNL